MFLYFIPGPFQTIPPDLQYAFDSPQISRQATMSGPLGSGEGTVIAQTANQALVKLDHANQTWKRIPNTDQYCGVWNSAPLPKPSDLQRPELIDGHPVALEDGSIWQCAIVRGFDVESGSIYSPIPRTLTLDESTGKWVSREFAPRYRKFANLAIEYQRLCTEAVENNSNTFVFDCDELAIMGLTANYRLSSIELSFYPDAYSLRVQKELLQAILDLPTIQKWNDKKKGEESAGSGS